MQRTTKGPFMGGPESIAIAAPAAGGLGVVAERAALVVGFALLTALGAQVRIPTLPVPITLQTFFVLLAGLMLGANLGAASQALYVLLGAVRVPVFAGNGAGLDYILGPTGGYLLGFAASAWLVGQLSRRLRPGSPGAARQLVAILALGALAVDALGACWLTQMPGLPPSVALVRGFLLFLPGDALKVAAASAIWLHLAATRRRVGV